jgi:hypothetical protein
LEENKNISVRKAYQNAQEIDEDWLRKIKYMRLKNLIVYFRLMIVLLAKKKINLRRKIYNWMQGLN